MRPIWIICAVLVLVGGAFITYKIMTIKPQSLTIAECREAVKNSDEIRKFITAYGYKDADQQNVIEGAAMRCFIDHDAETYSWSNDQKIQLAAHRLCSSKASERTPGDDVAAQTHRMAFQVACEAAAIERARNNK